MNRRRTKITGIGMVTPAGIGIADFGARIGESKSRVVALKSMGLGAENFIGATVPELDFSKHFPNFRGKNLPRHTQFALIATKLALADAGLGFEDVKKLNPVVTAGASLMDSEVINRTILGVERNGPRHALARVVFQGPVSAIGAEIGRQINGAVRTQTLQSACCSGMDAIGHAAAMVETGEADVAICGGTEAPLFYHPMLELRAAGLSPGPADNPGKVCRPFDRWRTTGVIGEGACFLVIEPESSPRLGYATVEGYGYVTDSDGSVSRGLAKAMTLAISNARIRPNEIDHLSCWGPGHGVIDRAECQAVKEALGLNYFCPAAYSIKGAIGNPLGAAGAIQVGCAALAIRERFIPPTVNWQFPDPSCRLNLSNRVRRLETHTAMVNSHGLSGTNSVLILKRCA